MISTEVVEWVVWAAGVIVVWMAMTGYLDTFNSKDR